MNKTPLIILLFLILDCGFCNWELFTARNPKSKIQILKYPLTTTAFAKDPQITTFKDPGGIYLGQSQKTGSSTTCTGKDGRYLGRATEPSGGTTFYQDNTGAHLGKSHTLGNNTEIYLDKHGVPLGNTQQLGNTTLYRDKNGNYIGKKQQIGNTTIYLDKHGNPLGSSQSR